jgi:glucose dehydrogenase
MKILHAGITVIAVLGIASCASTTARPAETTDAALRDADHDAANWLMYGRTYDDHRFSPLNEINEQTISQLGLVPRRRHKSRRS